MSVGHFVLYLSILKKKPTFCDNTQNFVIDKRYKNWHLRDSYYLGTKYIVIMQYL